MAMNSTASGILARMIGTLSAPIRMPSFGKRPEVATQPLDEATARATQTPGSTDRMPVIPTLTLDEAAREAFEMSHFVNGCVAKIATAVSSVPWGLEKRGKDRQWAPVPDSDYEALLERPNPFMQGQDLFERWTMHLILTGNCLGVKVRPVSGKKTQPTEIWPVQPDYIRPVPDKLNYLSHYEFRTDGGTIPIRPQDVIHIQISNPRNPHWGLSPLVALGRVIATEVDALTWWRQNIRNRASKLGYLSFTHELTPEQFDQVQQALIAQATGPWNAGLPFILGNEAKWVPGTSTPAEMDFVNLRKMTREEICGILGVSPIIMGIQEYSSYNNIVTARLMLWMETVVPILANMRAALDRALLIDFVGDKDRRQFQTGYDLTNVEALTANLVNVISIATALFAMGVPFQQINARLKLGFTPFPQWDTSWLPSGVVPADQLAENAAAGGAGAGAPPPGGADQVPGAHPDEVSQAEKDLDASMGKDSAVAEKDNQEDMPSATAVMKTKSRRFGRQVSDVHMALDTLRNMLPVPSSNGMAMH
jgi:HK97 family phage portal protein